MTRRCVEMLVVLALSCTVAAAGEIHDAARKGDLETVHRLAANPEQLGARDNTDRTPLHWACLGVHEDVAGFLMEQGADVNARDQYLATPLHSAAARGHEPVSRMLIEHGADVDIPDIEGHVSLHYAATGGHERVVRLLIEKGAALEVKDDHGRTPLVLAAREMGGAGVIRILLEAGADIDSRDGGGDTALGLAAWRGTHEVVDLLVEMGASVPTEGVEAKKLLVFAASKGLTSLFSTMAAKGVSLEFDTQGGGDLLHSAAAGGEPEIIAALIDRGFDLAKQDINGWAPLHFAADMGRTDAVKLLVKGGSDVDARTAMGQTAFNIAQEWGYGEISDVLAAVGADTSPPQFPELRGAYLGQERPGREPKIFARGIVNGRFTPHSSIAFSPDGKQAYWSEVIPPRQSGYGSGRMMTTRMVDGRWTYPAQAAYDGIPVGDCAFFSPDGQNLYDIATRPIPPETAEGRERIWIWTRRGEEWADPRPLGPAINDLPLHWQFCVDGEGNVYFATRIADTRGGSDVYCSELVEGKYMEPYNLGDMINSEANEGTPYIAPDGSYLIFSRAGDLHISFRTADGTWAAPTTLGDTVNTPSYELCPMVSPDGKYLFYLSEWAIKWVHASIIRDLATR
jgi:ankyrin repeat protein